MAITRCKRRPHFEISSLVPPPPPPLDFLWRRARKRRTRSHDPVKFSEDGHESESEAGANSDRAVVSGSPEFSRKGFFPSTLHGAPSAYDTKLIAVRTYLRRAFGWPKRRVFSSGSSLVFAWSCCFFHVAELCVRVISLGFVFGFYLVFFYVVGLVQMWRKFESHGIRATVHVAFGSVAASFGLDQRGASRP